MPKGTPLTLKCPKCMRGKNAWDEYAPRAVNGCRATGRVENRITKSAQRGSGAGGCQFIGLRGLVECLDCGHEWFSTHPDSGRIRESTMRELGIEIDDSGCIIVPMNSPAGDAFLNGLLMKGMKRNDEEEQPPKRPREDANVRQRQAARSRRVEASARSVPRRER